MKRAPLRVIFLVIGAVAIWGALLFFAAASQVTVVSTERHISQGQKDFHQRDCYVVAKDSQSKKVTGYGPSSFCTSLKKGDKITIKDGFVTKK